MRLIKRTPALPDTGWWVCLSVITLVGFLLALTGYNHGLPYIDYGDEMTMWTRGRATIDPMWDMFQPEYPPGMVWLSALVQSVQIARGEVYINPAGATAVGRITSVAAYTLALAVIMLLSWRLVEPAYGAVPGLAAGVSAGIFWLLLPLAIRHARYAMPDTWTCFWFISAIWAAVEARQRSAERWLWLSLLCAIVATLFKWHAAVALIVPGLMYLHFRSNRRRLVIGLVAYGLIVGVFSLWVVFVRRALEGGLYMPGTEVAAPTPFTLVDNLAYQLFAIGPALIFGLLPLAALLLPAARKLYTQAALWVLPLVVILLNLVISVNGSRLFPRHYLPGMTVLAVLAGVGFSLLLAWLWQTRARWVGRLLAAGLLVAVGLPVWDMARQVAAITADYLRPDQRVLFANWANQNAQDGVMLVTDGNLATALDPLYGYSGQKIATPAGGAFLAPDQVTDELLVEQRVRYLVAAPYVTFDRLQTPLTPLITSSSNRLRGEAWTVLYVGELPPLAETPSVTFGEGLQLRGARIAPTRACPGQTVTMQLLWSASRPPDQYYSYYLHFWSEATGELNAPINGLQPAGEHRPTISWTAPEELLVGPVTQWEVPADLPAGGYELRLGLFEPMSGVRLSTDSGTDYHALAAFEVTDCE